MFSCLCAGENLESVKPGSPEKRANLVKYISRNKIPFDYMDGKFRCGLCPKQYSGNTVLSKKYILRHVRKEHRGEPRKSFGLFFCIVMCFTFDGVL